MKYPALVCALLVGIAASLAAQSAAPAAQQSNNSSQYEGVSNPPPDDTITTPTPQPQPEAKPAPGKPMNAAPSPLAAPSPVPAPSANNTPASGMVAIPDVVTGPEPDAANAADAGNAPSAANVPNSTDGTDSGIVQVEPASQAAQPGLAQRIASNPDGDIVHPAPLPPGMLAPGTIIRVRLLERLSTAYSQDGETFRARVASDVFRGDQVLIPTGAEIDGTVDHVSTGHFGGHGSMLLHPDTVILSDGSRYHIYAQLTGAPESNTRVGDEGDITPGSRAKKDEIEYGGGVGAGVVAGAVLGGPAGALAGTVVGASAVTVHLLMDHPQATLDSGTVLDFTLTQPLNLVAANTTASE